MCFSATVSFTSSAALFAAGFIGTYRAWHHDKRFLPLNIFLFFFGFQQFCEGMIWINAPFLSPTTWGFLFLFFAFFIYPWYFSFSVYCLTKNPAAKRKILRLIYTGFIFALFLFLGELQVPDLGVDRCVEHIKYNTFFFGQSYLSPPIINAVGYFGILLYIFFTSTAFFISDIRHKLLYGCLSIGAAIVCFAIYLNYFISVWCFYAAMLAILVVTLTHCATQKRLK